MTASEQSQINRSGSGSGSGSWDVADYPCWVSELSCAMLSIDTGGTFTDAVALFSDSSRRRLKVLSDGTLRLQVASVDGRRYEVVGLDPVLVPAGLVGLQVVDSSAAVQAAGPSWIELDQELDHGPGSTIQLSCAHGPVILASRLLLGPERQACELRLATTRGTNALLTRRGARVVLLTNAGLEDLPFIRDQRRSELFKLRQPEPRPLAAEVLGLEARLAADGSEISPLTEEAIEDLLQRIAGADCEAVAIAMLHSDVEPAHESRLATELAGHGLRVVCSHQLSTSMGLLARLETACCEAYLAGIIDDFLSSSSRALAQSCEGGLWAMRSSGDLCRRADYRAVDSMLSGPAAGVLGAARVAARHGLEAVVAFDMGGTSTDVARIENGQPTRCSRSQVGGILVEREQLAIHTVAAGGGSIVALRGGRLRLGPESAGADPGPACYGRGGPLTLTDLQVLSGWLDPGRASLPLKAEASRQAARALDLEDSRAIANLVRLAEERMAEAVRTITLREGVDPAGLTLVAFGGAGGLHAAAVAAELGMSRVLIPRDASVLSAVGLEQARPGRSRRVQICRPLDTVGELLSGIVDSVAAQLAVGDDESLEFSIEMRLQGQAHSIELEVLQTRLRLSPSQLRESFVRGYRELHGYEPPSRPIEVVSLSGRSQGKTFRLLDQNRVDRHRIEPTKSCQALLEGNLETLGRVDLSKLESSDLIEGPALIDAPGTTILVPRAWAASSVAGDLILETCADKGGSD